MCGFAGIYNFRESDSVSEVVLKLMTNSIISRGPDDSGIFVMVLSDQDLGAYQFSTFSIPRSNLFSSPYKRYTLMYNAQIYNFDDFYPKLKTKGYQIKLTYDTEVLLYFFIEYGEKMLDKLNVCFLCLGESYKGIHFSNGQARD